MHKDYLGDSVYVEVDNYGGIVLTTENGGPASNTIVMEPKVVEAFARYMRKIAGNPQWPDGGIV